MPRRNWICWCDVKHHREREPAPDAKWAGRLVSHSQYVMVWTVCKVGYQVKTNLVLFPSLISPVFPVCKQNHTPLNFGSPSAKAAPPLLRMLTLKLTSPSKLRQPLPITVHVELSLLGVLSQLYAERTTSTG